MKHKATPYNKPKYSEPDEPRAEPREDQEPDLVAEPQPVEIISNTNTLVWNGSSWGPKQG